jgi:hypothetical protein
MYEIPMWETGWETGRFLYDHREWEYPMPNSKLWEYHPIFVGTGWEAYQTPAGSRIQSHRSARSEARFRADLYLPYKTGWRNTALMEQGSNRGLWE